MTQENQNLKNHSVETLRAAAVIMVFVNHLHSLGIITVPYFGISGGYWALGAFAAFVELVGGLFVALGFATRISAFFMIGTLFVASVMMMITKGYGPASHAIDDMFAFIGIFVAGPGKYSFDYKMAPEKEKK